MLYNFRELSKTRWRNILLNGAPFTTLNVRDNGVTIGTLGIYYRHSRWDDTSNFEKLSKGAQRYLYGSVVPRGMTKCLIMRIDKYEDLASYGEAKCSWHDQFSKAEGRKQALTAAGTLFKPEFIHSITRKGTGGNTYNWKLENYGDYWYYHVTP